MTKTPQQIKNEVKKEKNKVKELFQLVNNA